MLVYVATPQQFGDAFVHWCKQTQGNDRLMLHKVFNEFMTSNFAKPFYTTTHLYSFTIEQWISQFNFWRDSEIIRQPKHLETIRYWCIQLSDLLQSNWGVDYKLIVKECLEESSDIAQPHEPDLFDSLLEATRQDDSLLPFHKAS